MCNFITDLNVHVWLEPVGNVYLDCCVCDISHLCTLDSHGNLHSAKHQSAFHSYEIDFPLLCFAVFSLYQQSGPPPTRPPLSGPSPSGPPPRPGITVSAPGPNNSTGALSFHSPQRSRLISIYQGGKEALVALK